MTEPFRLHRSARFLDQRRRIFCASVTSHFISRRTVILAHLMTRQTANDLTDRCRWKLRLLRPLYQRGMPREVVRDLFRMIDWMMDLPTDVALQFESELLLF